MADPSPLSQTNDTEDPNQDDATTVDLDYAFDEAWAKCSDADDVFGCTKDIGDDNPAVVVGEHIETAPVPAGVDSEATGFDSEAAPVGPQSPLPDLAEQSFVADTVPDRQTQTVATPTSPASPAIPAPSAGVLGASFSTAVIGIEDLNSNKLGLMGDCFAHLTY